MTSTHRNIAALAATITAILHAGAIQAPCQEQGSQDLKTRVSPDDNLPFLALNIPGADVADFRTLTRAIVTPPSDEIAKNKKLGAKIRNYTGHEGHAFLRLSDGHLMLKESIWDDDAGWQNAVLSLEGAGYIGEIYDSELILGKKHATLKRGMSALFWPGAEFVIMGDLEFAGFRFTSSREFPLSIKLSQKGGVVISGEGSAKNLSTKDVITVNRKPLADYIKAMKSPQQLAREGAAEALGYLAQSLTDKARVVDALTTALTDNAMEVRRNAAESLGRLGVSSAQSDLRKLVDDPDEDRWVKEVAAEAIAKLTATET